jgi:hypothetical protein
MRTVGRVRSSPGGTKVDGESASEALLEPNPDTQGRGRYGSKVVTVAAVALTPAAGRISW